jgi:hypothetical protein
MGRFYHENGGIYSSQFWLELSIWVLIIQWHDRRVHCVVLAALLPLIVTFAIGPTFVESLLKTRDFGWKYGVILPQFNKYWSDLNLTVECGRADKSAQSADAPKVKRHGFTSTSPMQTADKWTNSTSPCNATGTSQSQSGCSSYYIEILPPGYVYLCTPVPNCQLFHIVLYDCECQHIADVNSDVLTDEGRYTC